MNEIEIVRLSLRGHRIVGTVPCGTPETPFGDIDGEDLEQWLCEHPTETFYLKLIGTSMVGYGFHPGMVIAVDCSGTVDARRGDIVLARVDGTDYTLKSWNPPYLLGDNGRERIKILMEPSRSIEIIGVAVGGIFKLR